MQNTTPLKVLQGSSKESMPPLARALAENATSHEVAMAVVALAVEEPLQARLYLGLELSDAHTLALCASLSPADARTVAGSILNVLDSPEFKARLAEVE